MNIDLPRRVVIEVPELEFVRQRGVSERVASQMVYEVTDCILRCLNWRQSVVLPPLNDYLYIYLGTRDEADLLFDQLYHGIQQQLADLMPPRFLSFFGVEQVLADRVIITHLREHDALTLSDDALEKSKTIITHPKGFYHLC